MKSFAFSVFLILISNYSFGQNSKIDLCEVYQHSIRSKNLDTITYLLQLDTAQVSNIEKSELLSMRGLVLFFLNYENLEQGVAFDDPVLGQIYRDMSLSIAQTQDVNQKLPLVYRRFLNLEEFEPHYKEYTSDIDFIISRGYRQDKFGVALTGLSRYDGEFWLGAELSFFSGYSPPFKLKDDNNQVILNKKFGFSVSALIFGYARNLESSYSDFNFSLLRIGAPLFRVCL